MTLGRLMYLYQAEQQGKQIMMREYRCGYLETYERITEVKITECELSTLVLEDDTDRLDFSYTYFIKDEENKDGLKINK